MGADALGRGAPAQGAGTLPGRLAAQGELTQPSSLAPSLVEDTGRLFRSLGIESCRASVLHSGSMALQGRWSHSETGEALDTQPGQAVDSQFPGAAAALAQLAQAGPEETVVQRLSPRHWSIAWRIDKSHVVIAEARYADARGQLGETDTALIRLVCDTGIRVGLLDDADDDGGPADGAQSASMVWPPSRDRRRRGQHQTAVRWWLALTVLSGAIALWMAWAAMSAAQDESAARRAMADRTLTLQLSVAMATGDYGEVQHALSNFESMGYFEAAAVANARQKLVSLAGPVPGLRIGDAVPAPWREGARSLDLSLGSESYGKVYLREPAPGAASPGRWTVLRIAATVAFAASAAVTVLMVLGQFRSRRKSS